MNKINNTENNQAETSSSTRGVQSEDGEKGNQRSDILVLGSFYSSYYISIEITNEFKVSFLHGQYLNGVSFFSYRFLNGI